MYVPKIVNVTLVEGLLGLVTLGPPIGTQVPVPTVGIVAASVGVKPQKKIFAPAFTGPTLVMAVIDTVDELTGQTPFEIDHCKISVPIGTLINEDVGELGLTTVPVPDTSVQLPVPTAGGVAFNVA